MLKPFHTAILVSTIGVLGVTCAGAGELYKWQDENGIWHFSSTPPTDEQAYDTLDMPQTMRSVIATLQDLGFQIEQADAELGTITATRFLTVNKRYQVQMMRMTITVAEREGAQVSVRANARVGERSVDDAETYQDFFVALDKAMFLTAQRVD